MAGDDDGAASASPEALTRRLGELIAEARNDETVSRRRGSPRPVLIA